MVNVFYNPNIHPLDEYNRRYASFVKYLRTIQGEFVVPVGYNPLEYFSQIQDWENRCWWCYNLRLKKVALWGKENGFKYFSTTLTISPYQNVTQIWEAGKQIEQQVGIVFVDRDFRGGFPESQNLSKKENLYRQNYCGCILSKWEGVKRRIWKRLTGRKSF
ncbi:MAG: epoxyqueuosine reductase [Candidatus Atribacteria bacterium]|nr:epoxyqueuosine reductase [Candidatus Atribacteria bacterium]